MVFYSTVSIIMQKPAEFAFLLCLIFVSANSFAESFGDCEANTRMVDCTNYNGNGQVACFYIYGEVIGITGTSQNKNLYDASSNRESWRVEAAGMAPTINDGVKAEAKKVLNSGICKHMSYHLIKTN